MSTLLYPTLTLRMTEKEKDDPLLNEKLASPSWIVERDAAVDAAVAKHDETELRRLSTVSGGFGSKPARRRAWSVIPMLNTW